MKALFYTLILLAISNALTGPENITPNHSLGAEYQHSVTLQLEGGETSLFTGFSTRSHQSKIALIGDYTGIATLFRNHPELGRHTFEVIQAEDLTDPTVYQLVIWNHYGPSFNQKEWKAMKRTSQAKIPQMIGFLGFDQIEAGLLDSLQGFFEIGTPTPVANFKAVLSNHPFAPQKNANSPSHSYTSHQGFTGHNLLTIVQDTSGTSQSLWNETRKVFISGERFDGWWNSSATWLASWVDELSHPISKPLGLASVSNTQKITLTLHPRSPAQTLLDTFIIHTNQNSLKIPLTWTLTKDTLGPTFEGLPTKDFTDADSIEIQWLWKDPSGISEATVFYSSQDTTLDNSQNIFLGDTLRVTLPPQRKGLFYYRIQGKDNQTEAYLSKSEIDTFHIADDDTTAPAWDHVAFHSADGGTSFWMQLTLQDSSGIYLSPDDSTGKNPKIQYSFQGTLSEKSPTLPLFPNGLFWETNGKWPLDSLTEKFTYKILAWDADLDGGPDQSLLDSDEQTMPENKRTLLFSNRVTITLKNLEGKLIDGEIRQGGFTYPILNGLGHLPAVGVDSIEYTLWAYDKLPQSFTWLRKNGLKENKTLRHFANLSKDDKDQVDTKDLELFFKAYRDKKNDADIGPIFKVGSQWNASPDGLVDFSDLHAFALIWNQQEPKARLQTLPRKVQPALELSSEEGQMISLLSRTPLKIEPQPKLFLSQCNEQICQAHFLTEQKQYRVEGKGALDLIAGPQTEAYFLGTPTGLPTGWQILGFENEYDGKVQLLDLKGRIVGKGILQFSKGGLEYTGPKPLGKIILQKQP